MMKLIVLIDYREFTIFKRQIKRVTLNTNFKRKGKNIEYYVKKALVDD